MTGNQGNHGEFNAIMVDQFTPEEIADSLKQCLEMATTQQRLELASQDPLMIETVRQSIELHDQPQDYAAMVRFAHNICQKYEIVPDFFVEAWRVCKMKLEAESFGETAVDNSEDGQKNVVDED